MYHVPFFPPRKIRINIKHMDIYITFPLKKKNTNKPHKIIIIIIIKTESKDSWAIGQENGYLKGWRFVKLEVGFWFR